MKSLVRISAILLLGLATVAASPRESVAQSTWSLQIADGVVSVNGRPVDSSRLPASLDTRQHLRLQWTGSDTTVVAFGDRYYLIERNGLREAMPNEIRVYGLPTISIAGSNRLFKSEPSVANRQLVNQLSQLAVELDQSELSRAHADAMRAAQAAAALPHLEMQDYWYGLRADDQDLFDDFVRERRLESEAVELSRSIRMLPSGNERLKIEAELRSVLDKSFELKQKNRQREIDQLEMRLEELRQMLSERESKRNEIIERRYRELIDPR